MLKQSAWLHLVCLTIGLIKDIKIWGSSTLLVKMQMQSLSRIICQYLPEWKCTQPCTPVTALTGI